MTAQNVGEFFGKLVAFCFILAVTAFVVHSAWEDVCVPVFHVPPLGYWDTAILILALRCLYQVVVQWENHQSSAGGG